MESQNGDQKEHPASEIPANLKSRSPRRRLLIRLLTGLIVLVAIALVGVYLFIKRSTQPQGPAKLSEEAVQRGVHLRLGTDADIFSDPHRSNFRDLAQTLEPLVGDLNSQVDQAEAVRLERDPYLAKTLVDSDDLPIFDGRKRIDEANIKAASELADFLIAQFEDRQGPSEISTPLRSALLKAFGLSSGDAESVDIVLTAAQSGSQDPLFAFLVQRLNRPASTGSNSLSQNIELCEKEGADPVLEFLIYSEIPVLEKDFSQEQLGKHYERFVQRSVEVIQQFGESAAQVDVFLNILWQVMPRANANVQLELFEQIMDAEGSPAMERARFVVAAMIARQIHDVKRGSSFFNDIPESNMEDVLTFSSISSMFLTKAWVLYPHSSFNAVALIRAQLTSGDTPRFREQWFRHAVSINSENLRAYEYLGIGQSEKWGRPERSALAMAELCSEANAEGSTAVLGFGQFIAEFLTHRDRTFRLEEPEFSRISENVVKHLQQFPKTLASLNPEYAAILCRLLWDTQQLEELDWFLTNIKYPFAPAVAGAYQVDTKLARRVCKAARGGASESLLRLHRELLLESGKLSQEDLSDLVKVNETFLETATDDASGAAGTFKVCLDQLQMFYSGDVVNFKLDSQNSEISTVGAEAVRDSERGIEFDIDSDQRYMYVMPFVRFPPPYRAKVTVAMENITYDQYGVALMAGPIGPDFPWTCPFDGALSRVRFEDRLIAADTTYPNGLGLYMDQGVMVAFVNPDPSFSTAELRLDVDPNGVTTYFNDKLLKRYDGITNTGGVIQLTRFANIIDPAPKHQANSYTVTGFQVQAIGQDE